MNGGPTSCGESNGKSINPFSFPFVEFIVTL